MSQNGTDDRCFSLIGKKGRCKMVPEDSHSSSSTIPADIGFIEHFLYVMPKIRELYEGTSVTDEDFLLRAPWTMAGDIVP